LERVISGQFGGLDQFKNAFKASAMNHEGNGWTFLVLDQPLNGKLEIISLPENQSVLSIGKLGILCCDLWEHAYNGHNRGGKAEWLDSFWEVVAWDVASRRLEGFRNGAKLM
jgi:Fe-Mn family superoxide dismutase